MSSKEISRGYVRKAAMQDVSRLAEILIFTKRMHYRSIFHNDKVSFGEMQVLPLAQEYLSEPGKLENIWVYDDEFVKGIIRIEDSWIRELYVDFFFQKSGIGTELLNFAVQEYDARKLFVLEKNRSAIDFYEKHGFSLTQERRKEQGTEEFLVKMERLFPSRKSIL